MATFTLDEKQELLFQVIAKRSPDLLPLLDHPERLSQEQREQLREIIADEFMETGLNPNDEPTPRGLLLENIIDMLGYGHTWQNS